MSDSMRVSSQRYGPLLDAWQELVERQLGPLLWEPRADTEIVDGGAVRVGPVAGSGVAMGAVDVDEFREELNAFLERYGFAPGKFQATPGGYLELATSDRSGAEFTMRARGRILAWVLLRP